MKRSLRSTSLIAATLMVFAAWATPVHATDVGGTQWTLEGSRSVTVQGQGKDSELIGSAILTFAGVAADRTGTCTLEIFNDVGEQTALYPCTWRAPRNGNTFSLTLSLPELTADLEAEAAEAFGVPVVLNIKSQGSHGVLRQQGTSVKLITRVGGNVTAEGDRKRSFAIKIKATGVAR